MKLPKVSIVTVVYNGVAEIESTVKSVLALRYPHIEYVVIDGGSTDGTLDILKRYADRFAYFHSSKDAGIYDAMNNGVAAATGDWVNFLNCGDRFYSPEALSFFETLSEPVDVVYGDAMVHYHTFQTVLPKNPVDQIWKAMPFCHQAAFVRRSLLREHPFDLKYRLSSDFNFFFNAYLAGARFKYEPAIICHFDYTKGASIKNSLISIQERKEIVLASGFSWTKWFYYSMHIVYVRLSIIGKKILGKRLSEWLIRYLKK